MKKDEKTKSKRKQKSLEKPAEKPSSKKLEPNTKKRVIAKRQKKITKPEINLNKSKTTNKELLKKREEIRQRRPHFIRQESWRYHRVKDNWRRPTGTDSKMRLHKQGWPSLVDVGYGSPSKARGLHPSGYRDVIVKTINDMETLNPETDAVRISATIGARKRKDIIDRAEELGLKVLNPCGLRIIKSKSNESE
jgi:large subunit ribosomal protein L32e